MRFFVRSATVVSILLVIVFSSVSITMASPYGGNTYGECKYGTGCVPTATPTPTASNNSGSGSSSNNSNTSCGDIPPSSAPNLFQIDRQGTSATLFLSPAGNPYNSYYIVYGFSETDERFAVNFSKSNSPGVITFTINALTPKTTYYFKVRAGYGCASGPWSQALWTSGVTYTRKVSFYPQKKSLFSTIYNTANNLKTNLLAPKPALKVAPQTPPTKNAASQQKVTTKAPSANSNAVSKPQSWWDKIVEFFK